jgi:hypothetical protein
MPSLRYNHLDDFALLRYASGELNGEEFGVVGGHVQTCTKCQTTLTEIEKLDRALVAMGKDPASRADFEILELQAGDPFQMPGRVKPGRSRHLTLSELTRAVEASEQGVGLSALVLQTVRDAAQVPKALLLQYVTGNLSQRLALLYALQGAGWETAENPSRFMLFADDVLVLLREAVDGSVEGVSDTERVVPLLLLKAQAHLLAGQTRLWTGDLELAGSHFNLAYQGFLALGDEPGKARAENFEAQRRFFTGHGAEALTLARRANATFAALCLEDEQARARGAEGMALFQMGRWLEAADAFREASAVFERHELWSNYVGMLNSLGNALVKLGRLSDARREYARALRRLSRQHHRSWVPFIRKGLAEVLFSAGRYREAAIQAAQVARLYNESGQTSRYLLACLFEVECWAREGIIVRARHRLELFRFEIERHGVLDPTLAGLIEAALSGKDPNFEALAHLRTRTDIVVRERFGIPA